MEIWMTTGKNGKKSAWYFNFSARRAFRIGMEKAQMMLATGEAVEVPKPLFV